MKIFVLLFAVILSAIAEPLHPERILSQYIEYNAEIRTIFRSMSSVFDAVNKASIGLVKSLYDQVVHYRRQYGYSAYASFREKYGNKLAEFKNHPEMNHCFSYAANVLNMNEWQKKGFSQFIKTDLKSWRDEFDSLDQFILDTRVALINAQKEAHECSQKFNVNGSDDTAIWMCAQKAIFNAEGIKESVTPEISGKRTNLTIAWSETFEELSNSIKNLKVDRFYENEGVIDDWFTANCAKPL